MDKGALKKGKKIMLEKPFTQWTVFSNTKENKDEKFWVGLKNRKLKKETDGVLIASKDHTLYSNSVNTELTM